MARLLNFTIQGLLVFSIFANLTACSSADPDFFDIADLDSKFFSATPKFKVLSDGSILDGNNNPVHSPMWNPRDFFYIPSQQLTNRDFENLDPRLVSVSQKPDTHEYWGLTSYGKIVRVVEDGSIDFNSSCPFTAGCEGWVRFQSLSAGRRGNLYFLDNQGRVFDARDLSKVLYTTNLNVTQVVYY